MKKTGKILAALGLAVAFRYFKSDAGKSGRHRPYCAGSLYWQY